MKKVTLPAAMIAGMLAAPAIASTSQLADQITPYVADVNALSADQIVQVWGVLQGETNDTLKARQIEAIIN